MLRALKIVECLKLSSVVCVFDQAIYSKAIEIKWKEKEKFTNTKLMMGMFHKIMMYMHILSESFYDAGLYDVLIQNSTTAEGSIVKALIGKMYNRGIKAYKLMYEAIMHKLILDHVEIGEDIYYQVKWRDDLDFQTFLARILFTGKVQSISGCKRKIEER